MSGRSQSSSQQSRPIVPQHGSDRNPANFVGRAATTARARERLKAGANLLLTDPRRMGKTFWMTAFAAQEDDFRPYDIDYEGVDSAEGFLNATVQALVEKPNLPARTWALLQTIYKSVDAANLGVLILKPYHRDTSPHELLRQVLSTLDEDEGPIPLVLMDEVPMAIDNVARRDKQEAVLLLQTLRSLRSQCSRVRWIVTGSIGFHHVLRSINTTSGVLNDLEALHLGPMPDDEARELARRLLLGIDQMPTGDLIETLVEVGGGIPSIMHKVAGLLQQRCTGMASAGQVQECFEDMIDHHDEFQWFEHLTKRVAPYYDQRTELAKEMLTAALSPEKQWVALSDLPPDDGGTLDALVADHYLEVRGLMVRWRYPALQYIWARRARVWDRR